MIYTEPYTTAPKLKYLLRKRNVVNQNKGVKIDIEKLSITDRIIMIVRDFANVPSDYCTKKSRKRNVVQARYEAMFLMKFNTKLSLNKIGSFFDKKHDLVLHGIKTISDLMDTDVKFRNDFTELAQKFNLNMN